MRGEWYRDDILSLVESGVGGFVLFEGSVEEAAGTIADLRKGTDHPLLFAADCEFGTAMRFGGGLHYPAMMALGEGDDPVLTEEIAHRIALEMGEIGIDWNFAPVLDVNSNPENPIINIRSFGENPEKVARHGAAYIRGMLSGGVIPCGKHFPGHGDTAVDSHIGLPVLHRSPEEMERLELLPFRRGIEEGLLTIMSAHLSVPALDPQGLPASLSPTILNVLRKSLDFNGVIVTDALDMGAIVETYGAEEGVVMAFIAGNDVLEIPQNPHKALQALSDAEAQGRIPAERIAESGERLDGLVQWSITHGWRKDETDFRYFDREESLALALRGAGKGLRVEGVLPNAHEDPLPVLLLTDGNEDESAEREGMLREFGYRIAGRIPFDADVSVGAGIDLPERLLVLTSIRPRGGAGTIGLGRAQQRLLARIDPSASVLLNLGNPHLLADTEFALRIDTFSPAPSSLRAALLRLDELR